MLTLDNEDEVSLIEFVESFGFTMKLSKLDNKTGIDPKPFVRFIYESVDPQGRNIPLVIYKEESFEEICDKIHETLIKVGNVSRDIEIKKLLFEDDRN